MLALLLMTALVPVEYTGEKAQEIKIHAKAPTSGLQIHQTLAIKNLQELNLAVPANGTAKEYEEILAKQLKVKKIDWDKQMVIVVFGGKQPTGGYSVELKSLEAKDKKLIVHWKLKSPGPDDIVTQAITYPELVLLVDRFDGQVAFDTAPKK